MEYQKQNCSDSVKTGNKLTVYPYFEQELNSWLVAYICMKAGLYPKSHWMGLTLLTTHKDLVQ